MSRFTAAVVALLLACCASAQTVDISVLIVQTGQAGCTVVPAGGLAPINGVNGILTAQTDLATQQVVDVLYTPCAGGTFAAPLSVGGGHPVGLDNGVSGGDVIEMAIARSTVISASGNLQFTFLAESATGGDVTVPSGIFGIAIPVPGLTGLGLLLLAVVLLTAAISALRHHRKLLGLGLCALAFSAWATHFVVDGSVADWAGAAPIVTDATGDASSGENSIDILAAFHAEEDQGGGGTLFFRVDLADIENTPPTAADGSANALEDGMTTANLAGNDADGDAITFAIVTGPTNGSLGAINQTGNTATVVYTPNADFNGADQFTYRSDDGQSNSANATVSVTVDPVNDIPSFTITGNVTVLEDAGTQNLAAFASGSVGPANESAQTLSFNVTANDNPALFSVAPVVANDGTLTFTAAAMTQGTANITLVAMDNGGTANGGLDTAAAQTFAIIVTDVNDPPSFTAGPNQTVLEDAGAQSVAAWATGISPGPADEAGQTVSFNITGNTAPGLFAAGPAVDATGTLSYTPAADANGSATITLVAMDDGGTANGGIDTSPSQSFDITVTAINDAPAFTVPASQTVLEDAGAQSFPNFATGISAGPANEAAQTLNFAITNNTNPGLFSAAPALAGNGTLTFTPTAQSSGSATITVDLVDNGGTANGGIDTATRTFDLVVTSVNDTPSFTAGPNQTVLEDAGAQSVAAWATGISPGPADEAGQTVSFNITGNTAPGLFAAGPAVDTTGTLSYTPAADANGSATITLVAMDDGGTTNGGSDTSPSQSFDITITGVNDAPGFTVGANPSVLEDAAAQTVNGFLTMISPGPADESGQTININITNNTAPGLFATGPAIDNSGNLTYTPATNGAGSATITVEAVDNGGTANGGVDTSTGMTFDIVITEVNDAPSFAPGANPTVNEDSGAQTDAGWATGISPGPASESGQGLGFMVAEVSRDTSLTFSAAPAVNAATGDLTFTAAANAYGVATYNVTLVDTGGTANGGVDTAGPTVLTVTVNPLNDPPTAVAPMALASATNMQIAIGAGVGLLNGAADEATEAADGTTLTVGNAGNPAPTTTANGGNLSITTATGAFTYNPPPGFTGMDSFGYVICDDGVPGPGVCTGTLTANITVSGPKIWFVDNSAASAGDGRLTTPFDSLAAFNAQQGGGMSDDPAAGDFVFLHTGAATYSDAANGIDLLNNQTLFGQATTTAFDTFVANTPPAGTVARPTLPGTAPSIAATNGNVVTLADGNTLRGLTIGDAGSGISLTGTSATNASLNVSEVTINGTGRAIDLDGYDLTVTFTSLASTASTGDAIVIDNSVDGSILTATSTTITTPGADGIDLANNGATSSFNFGTLSNITTTAGSGLRIANSGTVTIAGTPTISATGAPGIDITNTTVGGFTFDSLSSANSTTTGIRLANVAGAITFNNPGTGISAATGTAVDVDGGSGNFTYPGNIVNTVGNSANIRNRTGGAVTLSGTINDTGTGIDMNNNSGGTITLSGTAKSLNTGNNIAVNLTNNTGSTITFSGGGLDIDTAGTATGFSASGGGTVNITGNANSVTTNNSGGTGTAVVVSNTTIGASGVSFQSVNVTGASNGILLNTTGIGAFTVTGDGSMTAGVLDRDGSGGTLMNTTGDAVSLTSTSNVTLRQMNIDNSAVDGINSNGTGNIVLSAVRIQNPAGDGWQAVNLTGNNNRIDNDSLITQVNTTNTRALHVDNTNTDLTSFIVNDSAFTNQANTNGGSYVLFEARGTSSMTIAVQNNSVFDDIFGQAFQAVAAQGGPGSGTVNVTIANSFFQNADPGTPGLGASGGISGLDLSARETARVNYDINNNTFNDIGRPLANGGTVNIQGIGGTGKTIDGTFDNNDVDRIGFNQPSPGVEPWGHRFKDVVTEMNVTFVDAEASGNTIDETTREAFFVSSRDDSDDFDLRYVNNMLGQNNMIGRTDREAVEILSEDDSNMELILDNNMINGNTSILDQVVDIDTEDTSTMDIQFTNNTVTNAAVGGGREIVVDTENGTSIHCMSFSGNTAAEAEFDVNAALNSHRIEDFANIVTNNPGIGAFIDGAMVFDVAPGTCNIPDF